MKLSLTLIITMHFTTLVAVVFAQDCQPVGPPFTPRPPGAICRMVGKVKVDLYQTPESTSASMQKYLLGEPGDVVPAENARLRVNKDVLKMHLGFYAPRNVIPIFARLGLTSFSTKLSKYEGDKRLTIFVDDNPLFSENMEMYGSIGIAESFSLQIKYADFLKLTNAKRVTIQLGETSIKFSSDMIEALGIMHLTTKKLKEPPPPYM